jgi:hypothetical protein
MIGTAWWIIWFLNSYRLILPFCGYTLSIFRPETYSLKFLKCLIQEIYTHNITIVAQNVDLEVIINFIISLFLDYNIKFEKVGFITQPIYIGTHSCNALGKITKIVDSKGNLWLNFDSILFTGYFIVFNHFL